MGIVKYRVIQVVLPLLLFGSFLIGCSWYNKRVEDNLYYCLVEEYLTQGIDLELYLDSIENELILQNILSSKTGEARYAYYEEIVLKDKVPSTYPFSSFVVIQNAQSRINSIDCINKITKVDSVLFLKSKYFKLTEKMKKLSSVSPATVSKCYVSTLNENDLEHPFYRAWFILGHVMSTDSDEVYIRNISEK